LRAAVAALARGSGVLGFCISLECLWRGGKKDGFDHQYLHVRTITQAEHWDFMATMFDD
jgi:hypothetical protein